MGFDLIVAKAVDHWGYVPARLQGRSQAASTWRRKARFKGPRGREALNARISGAEHAAPEIAPWLTLNRIWPHLI